MSRRSEIESLAPSKLSLMPDNVVSQISYEQFIDLLAFLKSRKEQESLRGLVAEVGVTGPFPGDLKSDEARGQSDAKWQTLHAEPNGIVNLARFSRLRIQRSTAGLHFLPEATEGHDPGSGPKPTPRLGQSARRSWRVWRPVQKRSSKWS